MNARLRGRTSDRVSLHRQCGGLLSFVLIGLMSACTSETRPTPTEGEAAMYQAVIQDLVDRSGVELSETVIDPVVFVEVLESNTTDLNTQILVIDGLRDSYGVRFIDDIDEAVLTDEAQQPVRPGTILIVFGPIDVDETQYELHAEYYLDDNDAAAFEFHFENRQPASADRPGMVMTDEPRSVEPLLVVDP